MEPGRTVAVVRLPYADLKTAIGAAMRFVPDTRARLPVSSLLECWTLCPGTHHAAGRHGHGERAAEHDQEGGVPMKQRLIGVVTVLWGYAYGR
jgi:hypothetical protein